MQLGGMHLDLLLVYLARVLVEIAGFALLGQAVLALLAGTQRHENLFYRVLTIVAQPAVRAVRWMTPRVVLDAHIPVLTFFLLFWLWIALALAKRYLCGLHGVTC